MKACQDTSASTQRAEDFSHYWSGLSVPRKHHCPQTTLTLLTLTLNHLPCPISASVTSGAHCQRCQTAHKKPQVLHGRLCVCIAFSTSESSRPFCPHMTTANLTLFYECHGLCMRIPGQNCAVGSLLPPFCRFWVQLRPPGTSLYPWSHLLAFHS